MLYHFVITLQYRAKRGTPVLYWSTGTVEPPPGMTRSELFDEIYDDVRVQGASKLLDRDVNTRPVPLFFSLEPDQIWPRLGW